MGGLGVLAGALLVTLAVLIAATTTASAQSAAVAAPSACGFIDGFRALRGELGAALVGECLEHSRPVEGGVEQRTTRGLLVWHEVLNLVAFTDGHQTWIAGPNGIEVRPNTERFAWEEEALRAARAEAAAQAEAQRAPSPRELALIYVERVRGNNGVSLEKIYVAACYQAERAAREWLATARASLAGSVHATTHRLRDWLAHRRQQLGWPLTT